MAPALDFNAVLDNTPPVPVSVGARKVDTRKGSADGTVSSQWYSRPADERYTSIDDLAAMVGARRALSHEAGVDVVNELGFRATPGGTDHDMQLAFKGEQGLLVGDMTHWAFGQACGLAKAPSGYLRTLPSFLAADCLNTSMQLARIGMDDRQFKLMYQLDVATRAVKLMAINSMSYGRVWDCEVVDAVRDIVGTGRGENGWKIPGVLDWSTMTYDPDAPVTSTSTSLYASDRDVFMFFVDDRNPIEVGRLSSGEPDMMFRGFGVGNSETGNGALEAFTLYMRGICQNRNLWGVEGKERVRIRHNSGAPSRFIHELVPALRSFTSGDPRVLQQGVKAAKASIVGQKDDDVRDFLASKGFSRPTTARIMQAVEENEGHHARSVWDVVQGITNIARDIPHQDERMAMERTAGRLLDSVKVHLAA